MTAAGRGQSVSPDGFSQSIEQPTYWWYRARSELLRAALVDHIGHPGLVLDVGSADGPSVGWLRESNRVVACDLDPRGLRPGQGVCASLLELPFPDAVFDVVAAFDVIEHCSPESVALREAVRVLRPGGRLLVSVPAYQWAWSDHDVHAGHHRRYTRFRLNAAVVSAGMRVDRASYGFAGVFPFFVAERGLRRLRAVRRRDQAAQRGLTPVPRVVEPLLIALCRAEARWLAEHDLAFGSSVFLAATKPGDWTRASPGW